MCILNNYLVCYSDAFGREVYEEVIASNIEEAIENIQESNADGLYIPKIIAVEEINKDAQIGERDI